MFTKPQTLGAGDWIARDEIAIKLGATNAILQSTVLTIPGTIGVGRILVPDLGNLRAETAANRAGLSGVISESGDLATWVLPATLAESRRRCGVVVNQNGSPGNPSILQIAGPTLVLASDTTANLAVGAAVTIAVAADNSRGTVRLAAIVASPNQEQIVGTVLDPPRNSAGVLTNGTVATPLFCVIDFFGLGRKTQDQN